MFGNQVEKMAFDKSPWALVETSPDGKTIYMGKPRTANAETDDHVWFIKKVTIQEKDGGQLITTKIAVGPYEPWKNTWDERESLTYNYF